jgi:hypothetical protein
MPDASPHPDAIEHAIEREVVSDPGGTGLAEQGQPQLPPSEKLSTRLPTLGRSLGRKKGLRARLTTQPQRAIRLKVNGQVDGAQFTGIY